MIGTEWIDEEPSATEPEQSVWLMCERTATRLTIPRTVTFEQWDSLGSTLQTMNQSIQFWLGDWIRFGEEMFPNRYSQAAALTGYQIKTLQNAAYVAGAVAPSRRREALDFGHHSAVASLCPAEQTALLEQAETERLSVQQVRTAATRLRATQNQAYSGQFYRIRVDDRRGTRFLPSEDGTPSNDEAYDLLDNLFQAANREIQRGDTFRLNLTRFEKDGGAKCLREVVVSYPA